MKLKRKNVIVLSYGILMLGISLVFGGALYISFHASQPLSERFTGFLISLVGVALMGLARSAVNYER